MIAEILRQKSKDLAFTEMVTREDLKEWHERIIRAHSDQSIEIICKQNKVPAARICSGEVKQRKVKLNKDLPMSHREFLLNYNILGGF